MVTVILSHAITPTYIHIVVLDLVLFDLIYELSLYIKLESLFYVDTPGPIVNLHSADTSYMYNQGYLLSPCL